MLPEPEEYSTYFHETYREHPDIVKKRLEWKKPKKKNKSRSKQKNRIEMLCEDIQLPPEIELPSNASAFAVFASIRLAVLDRWMKQASQDYLQSSCSAPLQDQSEIESDTEENSQSCTYTPLKVSKVVGFGLRSVFEIIKESRMTHPSLCTKALSALLDVLQGQSPEDLKSEPLDIIDPLFDLLLDLATLHGPESSVANDGTHLTAIACACLLSLVVVRGDTGKYLAATAALLMCPRALSLQNIQMPAVLSSLQRSVHGVLLGKIHRPDWITHGIPISSKTDSFHLQNINEIQNLNLVPKSLAMDGLFLYLFTSKGLFKIGSGYGGTMKGHIYLWKPDFYPTDNGSLIYCAGKLYLKLCGRRGIEFLTVERNDLLISGSVPLHSRDAASAVVFSDGEYLGTISSSKDDGFVIRMLNQNIVPASVISELPLKLARKCVDVLGSAAFEDEGISHTVNTGTDEEIATICSGKEFGLIRTVSGKVLFCGKAAALGIKQSGIRSTKWAELVVAKTPKITQISVGHDGLHAILVAEDGSTFFTGTARRGEDGDQSKVRRQPKSIKPKKIIKADGYFIVSSACNNGTTALVTRDGELLMFGKDTTHADPNTGVVYNLKGEFIAQVALGKAHAVALTSKGQIYTFGINNKYQCGREFIPVNREGCSSSVVEMETCGIQEDQDTYEEPDENRKDAENAPGRSDGNNIESQMNMCPPGMHAWHDDRCMICTICRECTGYSISCLSSISERSPGQECGCGEGDSGCSICGCCRICAREVVDNSELADLAGMMRLDLIFRDKVMIPPRQRSKLQEQIQTRLEERKLKGRKSTAGPSKQNSKIKITRQSPSGSPMHRSNNLIRQSNMSSSPPNKEQVNSDVERDATRVACLPPARVQLPCNSPVVQIACGQHHSVLLCQNGQVYSFGSNIYGQLGCGDILAKNSIQLVKLPCSAVHVAAGNNHTVVLTSKGEVYTFGNHQKGQLGRSPVISPQDSQPGQSSSSKYISPRSPWYSIPTQVPNIGPRHGRRATWVGASGDQTFIKIDESLINALSIAKSTVTANKNSLVLVPNHEDTARSFSCLVINKRDGNCNSFKGKDQMSFCGKTICLDPMYNVVWSYNFKNHEIECFNIISSELNAKTINKLNNKQSSNNGLSNIDNNRDKNFNITAILSPELSLPLVTNCFVTRFQAALNLLCTLDTLTAAHDLQMAAVKEETDERQLVAGKLYSKEDYQVVNRFEGHGGGWGYSGHSIEAIRFMVDTDILLGGFGLFGGRGEYTAKLKLFDIGPDGGEQEGDGELITETEEIPYECGPRQKCSMLFDEPVQLQAHRWYVAWCRISGPSSDCGSSGQTMVTSEDQVLFYFKSSKKSNNGTDVNAGQIPQLLYKVITPESQAPPRQYDISEPVHILSKEFSRTVTKECFQSLLSLLQWSWNTFKWGIVEGQNIKNAYTYLELERLVYISKASLRLIRTYINEIYPSQVNKKLLLENVHLAESIGDVRSLLKQILSDNLPMSFQSKKSSKWKNSTTNMDLTVEILEECHQTFVQCFHAFYPTAYLKWTCLCDLLTEIDKEGTHQSSSNSQRLLSAVLCSLCSPNVRLRSTFPLLGVNVSSESSIHRNLSPSDNTGHPMMSCTDSHYYPILVEQMSYKSQVESSSPEMFSWPWTDVLEKLLHLVADPVMKNLNQSKTSPLLGLTRHCCHLLGRVVAELVHQCSATEEELQSGCGRIIHITPSRFTRTNQSRTWNTGNGSPDAICFQVDHPGISIAGVGVYGGIGHYDYEVELLEDQSTSIGGSDSHTHTQRWNILEVTRGSFGPEDFAPDIIEIKFDRAVAIKENTKYAIRLRNHGGRTNNGDGGLSSVKGSDGTNFVFSTCSLSFNGTTLTRGQIPVLLYYSNPMEYGKTSTTKLEQQARKSALSMTSAIFKKASELMTLARSKVEEVPSAEILSDSYMVTTLLPLVAAHTSPLVTSDPRSAVYMLGLIYDLLPHVAALNLIGGSTPSTAKSVSSITNNTDGFDYRINTSSPHYIWVESEHPYKPATVSNYRVKFPESVKWLSLEFDPSCSTVQPEDTLQLYVPALGSRGGKYVDTNSIDIEDGTPPPPPYWPVLHKFSGCLQWPSNAVILPGNEVIFSLETASDYLKDDKASAFGFKCLVIGYEWPLPGLNGPLAGLKHLESELAFLGGMCAASLMKKDLLLPTYGDEADIDVEMAEMVASVTFAMHAQLLSKGLALNNPPSVSQALDGMLPYSVNSNERMFLRDFVGCVAGTSGGRLAQWLQPGSRVDPSKCQVLYSREELRCGWPAMITVITRDQYADIVQVPNMKVDIKALPIDKNELGEADYGRKLRRVSQTDMMTFGGLPPPPLHYPYEPTVRDKMYFHSITVMKPYQNYSFEELRYISPPVKRSSESMMVRPNLDGTYTASWTPASVGCYSIVVNIDGYDMEEVYRVEVKEPPQGMTPPSQQQAKKNSNQPNKLRKFVAKNSAGLRIRAHPSLQSEQIGVVHVNGTIAFIDEIHNDDGVWLRLSMDTIKQYCNGGIIEAWCLQYNQHLGKTLLLPVEDPKSTLDQVISETIKKKLPEIHDRRKIPTNAAGDYILIKCGASGHNVRSKPHLNAPRVGMLVLGNRVGVSEYIVNSDGCWVLLDQATRDLYCFNTDDEAWSLAMDHNNTLYLGSVTDKRPNDSSKRGFDFTQTLGPMSSDPHFFFGSPLRQGNSNIQSTEKASTNPFIFGECSSDLSQQVPKREKKDGKISILPKWVKGEDEKSESFDAPNFHRQESTRSHPENRANGNGTPPDTPKRSNSPSRGPFSPKVLSRSSSPVAVSSRGNILADSAASSTQVFGSPKSIGISPLASSVYPEHQPRRDSTQSDTSAFGSSLTRDSHSPGQATPYKDLTSSPSGSSIQTRSDNSPPSTPCKRDEYCDSDGSSKKLTQTGTQTSPENLTNLSMKGHFSIGSTSKEEKISPKLARKDRGLGKVRPRRSISPAGAHQASSKVPMGGTEQAKIAMSPTMAEALRAVFAAFLWHEGIVHDAMACASFLKFHPTLPKQGAVVVTRHLDPPVDKRRQDLTKEERARQRHSVEVTTNAGSYLHIQPATLESLTRSAANANANRNRSKRISNQALQDEADTSKATSSDRSGYGIQTVSVLPPALKSLVYLWEELSTSCFQAISQQMILRSPLQNSVRRKEKMTNNTKNDCRDKNSTLERDSRKTRKKKPTSRNYLAEDISIPSNAAADELENICELCGENYPYPVTFHMHQAHPGCGQHAGGKGYNSRGNYCLGWAGSCGDGGVPGSSWYLMCENCREKYVKAFRSAKQFSNRVKNLQRRIFTKPAVSPSLSPISEPHIIMKNNAMFLLDLASSADTNMAPQRRSSMGYMPSLSENNSPPDCSGPFSPMPPFQCLQSLGASLTKDETNIYEVMFRQHNMQDGFNFGNSQRPLSEISVIDDGESAKGSRFHRSISMGTNGIPWSKSGVDGRLIMTRRRNNSSSESLIEGGSSLLCNPSGALQQLIPKIDHSSNVVKDEINGTVGESGLILLQRPVMQFLLQHHDLQSLKLAMRQALRKAMCRVYAMQALNWLLKSVTQPLCLHDLLWWFVTSLTPTDIEVESEDDNRPAKKLDDQDFNVCEHPLSDIIIAGDAVHPLPSTFHALLQTIADLMVLLPMGSPIQQMAVRCWGLRFATSDHSFLHRSQVFSNISKILSRSEELEDCTISMHDSHHSSVYHHLCAIESLKDLTFAVEIKSSSRQAMVGSLTDGSTETFWESGDEDRNKTKSLVLVSPQGHYPVLICFHIDNCRDLANKVSNITFYSGPNSDDLVKLGHVELETRLIGGWVNCPVPENNNNVIKVELKGPDNSVRVRQIRVLGKVESESLRVGKQLNPYTIQQKNCEAETLRVFRLITSQVFGKLIQGEEGQNKNMVENSGGSGSESLEPLEESNDLREHMVGILFSRSKLTHLQKQVIVHIVQAIRKETLRVRDEWELALCSSGGLSSSGQSQDILKNSDTYCFEMLSMVLALSGSSVGRSYLSHQGGLLGDLLSLLHTGSARVQRQVTSLLRRMLPEITPDTLAKVMGVTSLPPKDFNVVLVNNKAIGSEEFDIHKSGILDVFLSIIAKALTVQVKLKGKTGCGSAVKEVNTVTLATSVHPKENLESRWWLKGYVNRKLAEVLVNLIKDMAAGKLSDTWARIAKGAIAENILNLTHLSEEQRTPTVCLKTPTLWLALASLCVLDKDHVERLSSGQWTNPEGQPAPPRPTCSNHDDGETNAVIQCSSCGNLCADCDRFLHLHRKTRHHQRQVCKEEEEAIKVELHEGCGRIKLFWLLALADARTLKALIEYREGGTRSRGAGTSGVCRFCGATGTSGLLAIGNVCADQDCQEYSKTACTKLLNCGHMCGGILDETKCLPCLHGCTSDPNLRQDADDMCMICFTEALSCAPAIQLTCGHVFHLHCCKTVLMKKWSGPRITFSFSQCPICKKDMEHPNLEELLEPIKKLLKDVQRKALMRLEYEGLHKVEAVVTPGARFYNDPASYAMDRYAYYVCFKCNKAYYGGEARCDAEVGENYDPTELVCGACSDVARAQMCPKHGTDFLEYKCRYCCSVAVFFCFGTTHFCNPCHDDFQRVTNLAKSELPNCPAGPKAKQLEGDECPLHIKHPPTGEEFALGCGVCRNAHTF